MRDLLVLGKVWTGQLTQPQAEAVLCRDGRIVAVGTRAEVEPQAARDAEVREAAFVTPGLVDGHAHAALVGRALVEVDLSGASSALECVARVAARARSSPRGTWIRGGGWDHETWTERALPTQEALSAAVPDHPVALWRVDLHSLWVNRRALQECGIDAATPDPQGGKIVRGPDGAPTGVLVDTAADAVVRRIPDARPEELDAQVLRACESLAASGLTGLHDACVGPALLQSFLRLGDRLPLRVHLMLDGNSPQLDEMMRLWAAQPEQGLLSCRSVKLFADGALGSRGAKLFDSYEDDSGNTGLWVTEPAELRRRIARVAKEGFSPCVHAIGDRACHEVLHAFATTEGLQRPRVEHLQIVRPEDFTLLQASGAIGSMQPIHAVGDGAWAAQRLGRRTDGAYAWRSVAAAGAVLALGSDAPVEPADVRLGLHSAVVRRPRGLDEPWMPHERLTLAEALRGYSWGNAWAERADHRRGVLRAGLDADLTLFGRDLFTLDPDELPSVPLAGTVVAGRFREMTPLRPAL